MNILEELYLGNIREVDKTLTDNKKDEELKLYNQLKLQLNPEQNELFDKLIDLLDTFKENLLKDKYIQGFKTGLLIGIETAKLEL